MNEDFIETDGSVDGNSHYRLIVPEGSTPTYIHVHAMGAASNFYEDVYYILNGDRNKDTAYLLLDDASGDTASSSAAGYAKLIEELSTKYNVPASNISIAAFSRGSNVGATTYADLVEAGFKVPYYVHMSANSTNLVVEDYKRVAEVYKNSSNPPPFIYINDSTNNADRNLTNALAYWPGDVIELKNYTGYGGSHSCDYQYILNNLNGFLNGTSTLEKFEGYESVKVYTLDANGNRVEKTFATAEEFEEYFTKYRDLLNGTFTSANYTPIKFNIDDYEKVQSNDEDLQTYIDAIRNNLKIEASLHSYNSTTMVPNQESEAIQNFFEGTQSLFGVIESDTTYLLKVGLALKELDTNLSAKIEDLPDVPEKEAGKIDSTVLDGIKIGLTTGAIIGGIIGGIIGSVPGVLIGTLVGAAVGTIVGGIVGLVTSNSQKKAADTTKENDAENNTSTPAPSTTTPTPSESTATPSSTAPITGTVYPTAQ